MLQFLSTFIKFHQFLSIYSAMREPGEYQDPDLYIQGEKNTLDESEPEIVENFQTELDWDPTLQTG